MSHKGEERPQRASFDIRAKTPAKQMPRECPVKAKAVDAILKKGVK